MKTIVNSILLTIAILFISFTGFTQQQQFLNPGTYTWEVPSCVTEITVQVWGAGGGGGGTSSRQSGTGDSYEACTGGGGGGGGGFSMRTYSVVPGQVYTVVVGAGGAGGTGTDGNASAGNGHQGGQSTFNGPAVTAILLANGGAGGGGATAYNTSGNGHIGDNGAGGAGGSGANGSANYSGGNGSGGSHSGGCNDLSGAGGGAAGPGGNGGNAQFIGPCPHTSAMQGGTGANPGGTGGNGIRGAINNRDVKNGNNGISYGGGGGGGNIHLNNYAGQWQRSNGGAGANGAVIIQYSTDNIPNAPIVNVIDPDCDNDGSASIAGYNSSYTYTFTPAGPTVGAGGVISGATLGTTYTVTVSEVPGCVSPSSNPFVIGEQLSEPDRPTVTVAPATCDGDGVATITNYDPNLTYVFVPAGPTVGAGGIISGLTPATSYDVYATNGSCNSVTDKFGVPAQLPSPAVPNISIDPATCDVDGEGRLTNHNSSYTYSFSPNHSITFGPNGEIQGATPGTAYTITVTGSNGCTSTNTFTIPAKLSEPSAPNINVVDGNCSSGGSVSITNYSSSSSYSFSPNGPSIGFVLFGSRPINNYTPGTTYTITVTGSNGCTSSTTFTAPQQLDTPDLPIVNVTDPSCTQDGSAVIGNYDSNLTYSFNPGGITIGAGGVINGATFGQQYTVTATNGDCPTSTVPFTIESMLDVPDNPVFAVDDPSCGRDGSASVTNYTSGINYVFNPAGPTVASDGSISGMTPNTNYDVTASNGSCSSQTVTVSIDEALEIPDNPIVDVTAPSCTQDGSASISNYNSGYTYVFSDPSVSVNASGDIVGASFGQSYTVYVIHSNDCQSDIDSFTIEEKLDAPDTPDFDLVSASCYGDGTLTILDYDSSLDYVFSPAGPTVNSDGTVSGLVTNVSYTLTASNGSCSSSGVSIQIEEQLDVPDDIELTINPATCDDDGSVVIANYDLTMTYVIVPNDPTNPITIGANGEIHGAMAGFNYTIFVENADECNKSETFTVPMQLTQPVEPAITVGDPTCSNDGSVVLTNYNSSLTYSFSPTGPSFGSGSGSTRNINGVQPGVAYTIVADNGACTSETEFMIDEQLETPIAPDVIVNAPDCDQDGSAVIDNYDSNSTYIFSDPSIIVGSNGEIVGAALETTYTVIVNNGDCPSAHTVFTIYGQHDAPNITLAAADAEICYGESTTLSASGGVTYTWDNGLPSGGSNQVSPEVTTTYTVTGEDANGCEADATVTITVNQLPVLTIDADDISCNGAGDGEATVSATGAGSYTYAWSPNGGSNATATGLDAGTYTVTVTDGNDCESEISISITEPDAITLSTSSVESDCSESTGSATVTAVGGTGDYSYAWDANAANQTSATATDLSAGVYEVTVTDDNSCTESISVTVGNPDAPEIDDVTVTDVTCEGGDDGSISVVASGGTGELTYSWSPNSENTAGIEDLTEGTYVITITDEAGCVKDSIIEIDFENLMPVVEVDALVNELCEGGAIELTSTVLNEGADPTYSWEGPNGFTSSDQNPTIPNSTVDADGTYTLTVTGDGGCESTVASVEITVNPTPEAPTAENNQEFCGEGTVADLLATGENVVWYDAEVGGNVIDNSISLTDGGVYYATQTVDGCESESVAVTVEIFDLPVAGTISGDDLMCEGGELTLTSDGDASGVWSSSDNNIAVVDTDGNVTNGDAIGTVTIYYTVDGEGDCEASVAEFDIDVVANPSVEAYILPEVVCEGDEIVLSAFVSDENVNFFWTSDNGYASTDPTPVISNSNSNNDGMYYITIVSENGCSAQDSVEVIVNPFPIIDEVIMSTATECMGLSIELSVSNPDSDLTYIWVFDDEVIAEGDVYNMETLYDYNAGTYYVYAQTDAGCSVLAEEIELTIEDCGEIVVVEAFSPDGDGINDYFHIDNLHLYPNTEVWIYNRWGALVYHSDNYQNDWDGTSQNKMNIGGDQLPEGTFYYILKLGGEGQMHSGELIKGFVYLMR